MLEPVPYRLEIWRGDRWTGTLIHEGEVALEVLSGGFAGLTVSWKTDPLIYGEIPHTFALHPVTAGAESDTANNTVTVALDVAPPATLVRGFHVFPNPVGDLQEASLRFELLHPESDFTGEMEVSVYGLDGDLVGRALLRRTHIGIKDIAIGVNTLGLASIIPAAADLAPGLYICIAELSLIGQTGTVRANSKFAVAR
jgi:hypothetical protein